jgi:hypothetical protein
LKAIAAYPLITAQPGSSARSEVLATFAPHGLAPRFVLSVTDLDVMKACVEETLGIAIVPCYAFSKDKDTLLTCIKAAGLFPAAKTVVATRRNQPLPAFADYFCELMLAESKADRAVPGLPVTVEPRCGKVFAPLYCTHPLCKDRYEPFRSLSTGQCREDPNEEEK